jgi:Fungal N-terminal domain of STAND proteins
MADPLSITASVIGITVPALQGTRFLLDELHNIKDAPETIKRLETDVRSVDLALTSLRGVEDQEWKLLGASIVEESKATITSCTNACNLFRADLQQWTRHSADGKLAWRDRANVGFLKQSRIRSISEQLQSCKMSINSVVSIATL